MPSAAPRLQPAPQPMLWLFRMTFSGTGTSSRPSAEPSDDPLSTTVTWRISGPSSLCAIEARQSLRRLPVFRLTMTMSTELFRRNQA